MDANIKAECEVLWTTANNSVLHVSEAGRERARRQFEREFPGACRRGQSMPPAEFERASIDYAKHLLLTEKWR